MISLSTLPTVSSTAFSAGFGIGRASRTDSSSAAACVDCCTAPGCRCTPTAADDAITNVTNAAPTTDDSAPTLVQRLGSSGAAAVFTASAAANPAPRANARSDSAEVITAGVTAPASSATVDSRASEPSTNSAAGERSVSASNPATSSTNVSERSTRSALTSSGVTIATTAASGSTTHTAMSSWPVISAMPPASIPADSISDTANTLP